MSRPDDPQASTDELRCEASRADATDPLLDPERHFLAVIQQVKDYAIFSLDLQGRGRTWNEGVERILGFSADEFVGHDVTSRIFTPEAQQDGVPQRELEQAAATGQANDDRWMRRKDGSLFFAAGITTAVRDDQGELIGYVKVMRDQTQWKQLQSQLQQTVDELARTDRHRSEFIAMLAHELRNPLAPLRHGVHVLPRVIGEAAAVASIVAMMERQVSHMGRLIDDLLDVSRLTRGRIELRRQLIEIGSTIGSAVEAVRAQYEQKGHTLAVTPAAGPIHVDADPTRLTQVIVNLLNNAAKFTPAPGRVWLSTEREGDEVVIRVRDTGVGLELDEQLHIFELFAQIDASIERSQGGLGIGLTLVRRLVELHGGTVAVHSAGRDQGSEFIVRLPTVDEPMPAAPEPPAAAAAVPARRVLVVDDNVDAAHSLATWLELGGHEVRMAHDGAKALEMATADQPEVVVLDIGLPVLNGFDVARRLRQQRGDKATPLLVALTGWGQPEDRRRSFEAGFDAHLVKPVEPAALDQLLRTLSGTAP